jgi:uncharacterized BrkB/YihY/UPF0761 family membrane protein
MDLEPLASEPHSMTAKTLFALLLDTFDEWSADRAPRLGAALAYDSAQIFLFGTEFTRVYTTWRGRRIEPTDNAVWLTAESLMRQGLVCRPGRASATV